jgi:hypothetical protein
MQTSNLPLAWQAFHLPKQGSTADEYEDAFAGAPEAGRFAIADGASESSYAGIWAGLLAQGFLNAPAKPWRELDWIEPLRHQWARAVDGRPLPWYAEMKREQGAYATLLGLAFRKGTRPQEYAVWRALAVGDSCLFHVRGSRLRRAFPVEKSAQMNNRPALIGSRPGQLLPGDDELHLVRGRCRQGDCFLLMSDALAAWFLEQNEQDRRPISRIQELLGQEQPEQAFPAWVEERRRHENLRNDDVTLTIIDLI